MNIKKIIKNAPNCSNRPFDTVHFNGDYAVVTDTNLWVKFPNPFKDLKGQISVKSFNKIAGKYPEVSWNGTEIVFTDEDGASLSLTPDTNEKSLLEDLPNKDFVPEGTIEFTLADFCKAESFTKGCASDEATRQYLRGFYLDAEAKAVVTTDGRKLAHFDMSMKSDSKQGVILPKAVSDFLLAVSVKEDADEVVVKFDSNKVTTLYAGIEILSENIGTFPNWKQVVPNTFENEVLIQNTDKLQKSVKKLASLKGKNVETVVKFDCENDTLSLSVENDSFVEEWGKFSASFPAKIKHTDVEIPNTYFAGEFLPDVIIMDCMRIKFGKNFLGPVVFEDAKNPSSYVVCMPRKP